jgi:hypothetical protein
MFELGSRPNYLGEAIANNVAAKNYARNAAVIPASRRAD